MKSLVRGVVLAGALALMAMQAQAQVFNIALNGASEAPPNGSLGVGVGRVTITGTQMRIETNFIGLTGTTTAAHIHAATAAPFTGTAGVAVHSPSLVGFPLGVTSGSYDNTLDMTLTTSYNATYLTNNGGTPASAFAALLSSFNANTAYLNIHTSAFPGGEIRGFLVAAPEPGTLALLGLAAIPGVALLRRRRA